MSLFDVLFDLVCLPFEHWKRSAEESRLGLSEADRKAGRVARHHRKFRDFIDWSGLGLVALRRVDLWSTES